MKREIKNMLISLGVSSIIFLALIFVPIIQENLHEKKIEKAINGIDKPMNDNIKQCLYNHAYKYRIDPTFYSRLFFLFAIDSRYNECRYQSKNTNISFTNINYSCNILKKFIDINEFPKNKRVCYTQTVTDLIEKKITNKKKVCPEIYSLENNCGQGCKRSGQSNYITAKEYKQEYIKRCITETKRNKKLKENGKKHK